MNSYSHHWHTTYATMQQHRPRIERRARLSPGRYRGNLAREWCLFLMKEIPLD
ncbi:hypothetical protein [Thiothrix lacustris]|uniref:hypothetical protein n=1 Tax=Thiothrix lacustris TaxID=525917 RepID=UPI0027E488EB|nr:hypothetical protein [Thiothrix lacustris]WMP16953.1 hypothetical protein RCS87_16465 [Thiothrix lacustris]